MSESFVGQGKQAQMQDRMERLGIREEDLLEKFILGSGKGGQKVNKTSSCVYLRHIPTGLDVKCQHERSRELNRYEARRLLCDKMEERRLGIRSARQQAFEKIRRQKRRRSRRQKAKMLDEKRKHAVRKDQRRAVDPSAE